MSTATNLSGSLKRLLSYTQTAESDLSVPTDSLTLKGSSAWSYGVGANQAHYGWSDRRTLGPATIENLDLYDAQVVGGAAANDALGRPVTTAKIKAFCIAMANTVAAVGDMLVVDGGTTTQAWTSLFQVNANAATQTAALVTPGIRLGPGGSFLVENPSAAGYAVADITNHYLRVYNPGATTIAYDIAWMGCNS